MDCTARLALPFLSPGQAQKEVFHNEALQRLDVLVAAAVEEPPRISPPENPAIGSSYIVGKGAAEAWAGQDGRLAAYSGGGWRFIEPPQGMSAYVRSTGLWAVHSVRGWEMGSVYCASLFVEGQQVVGARSKPIAASSGGSTIDKEARSTLSQVLQALRRHGLIEM